MMVSPHGIRDSDQLESQLGSSEPCSSLLDRMSECEIMTDFNRACGDNKNWNFGNCMREKTNECCPRTCCLESISTSSQSPNVKATSGVMPSTATTEMPQETMKGEREMPPASTTQDGNWAASKAICEALQRKMKPAAFDSLDTRGMMGKQWKDACEKTAVREDSKDGEEVEINEKGDVVVLRTRTKTTASNFSVLDTMWSRPNGCSWTCDGKPSAQPEGGDWFKFECQKPRKCEFVAPITYTIARSDGDRSGGTPSGGTTEMPPTTEMLTATQPLIAHDHTSQAYCEVIQRKMKPAAFRSLGIKGMWKDACEKMGVQAGDGRMVAINEKGDVVVLAYEKKTGKFSYTDTKITASNFSVTDTMWSLPNGCSWTCGGGDNPSAQPEDGECLLPRKCQYVRNKSK